MRFSDTTTERRFLLCDNRRASKAEKMGRNTNKTGIIANTTSDEYNTTADNGKSDHIQELLDIAHGRKSYRPLGRKVSCAFHRTSRIFNATQFNVRSEDDWTGLIEGGLTWSHLFKFAKRRACVQIGPLYLGCREFQLEPFTFQTLLHLGRCHEGLYVAIVHNQESEQRNRKEDEATLRGLIKLYAATTEGESKCCVSCIVSGNVNSLSTLWPFSCDWGVILDKITVTSYNEPINNSRFFAWLSRNFRGVNWDRDDGPTKDFWHYVLVDPKSVVEHVECSNIKDAEVDFVSAAVQQSSEIKSLKLDALKCNLFRMINLVQACCKCEGLRKIALTKVSHSSAQLMVDCLIPLIRCGHVEDIKYFCRIGGDEFRGMPKDECRTLKNNRTQTILDAIEANKSLLWLNLKEFSSYDSIDVRRINTMVKSRKDGSVVLKMSQLLVTECPLKLALYGKMICRLGSCENKYKKTRSINMLFDLLCETNTHAVQMFRHPQATGMSIGASQRKRKMNGTK